jgi:hypothetical protein
MVWLEEELQELIDTYRGFRDDDISLLHSYTFDAQNRHVTDDTYNLLVDKIAQLRDKEQRYGQLISHLKLLLVRAQNDRKVEDFEVKLLITDSGLED